MKRLQILTLLATVGLIRTSTFGTTFDFSYQFLNPIVTGGPKVVTGSFEGDLNGDLVHNVHNVSVFFDGVRMSGTLYAAQYLGNGSWISDPIVSFNVLHNNFAFFNSDVVSHQYGATEVFGIFYNPDDHNYYAEAYVAPGPYAQEIPSVQEHWSLFVPEGGFTITMLGTAVAGLTWMRRKLSA